MMKKMTAVALLAAIPATIALAVAAPQVERSSETVQRADEVRLRARLNGDTLASGTADYRERTRRNTSVRRFSVEIEDAAPNTLYTITHNGAVVGEVMTNEFGFADFNLRTLGDDSGKIGNVPQMFEGDVIEVVGLLSGTLAAD